MSFLVRIRLWMDEWQQACARHSVSSYSSSLSLSLSLSCHWFGQQMEWVVGWLPWRFKGVIAFQLGLIGPFFFHIKEVYVCVHMWVCKKRMMKLLQAWLYRFRSINFLVHLRVLCFFYYYYYGVNLEYRIVINGESEDRSVHVTVGRGGAAAVDTAIVHNDRQHAGQSDFKSKGTKAS